MVTKNNQRARNIHKSENARVRRAEIKRIKLKKLLNLFKKSRKLRKRK